MPAARQSEPVFLRRVAGLVGASPPAGLLPGDRRRTGRGHVDSYGDDRVCQAPGCGTRLSRYNRAAVCWHHGEGGSDHGGSDHGGPRHS